MKLHPKPLGATMREHLRAQAEQRNAATIAEIRKRIAPPTSTNVHQLRLLDAPPETPSVAAKKRKKHTREYKADVVARALKAQNDGNESVIDIATAEKLSPSGIYKWIKDAKAGNEPMDSKKRAGAGDDMKAIAKDLSEAMERVESLKKRLRKLLG